MEYDYIIVGGGSAGCVLANRLSENKDNKVLLLEAGPSDWNIFIHMPMGFLQVLKSTTINWHYETAPEKKLKNRQLNWPRGKVLGGSSSINAAIYIRGASQDYDLEMRPRRSPVRRRQGRNKRESIRHRQDQVHDQEDLRQER